MSNAVPLKGLDLIDCAKASSKEGINAATYQCGYGENIDAFEAELQTACEAVGIDFRGFFMLSSSSSEQEPGLIIAPDADGNL
jgi:hypothetical protein